MSEVISRELGRYALNATLDALSEVDRAHMADAFVNWIGCAVGGSVAPATDAYVRAAQRIGTGQYKVLGRQERFGLVEAVTADCLASAAYGFDDTHLETVLHPTGPVAAALLGQARLQPIAGREFLTALHVGMEVQCRAGLAIAAGGTGVKRGWYLTGVAGGIGAAAALGRILGFDDRQMMTALALAAARASGNRGTHGTMAAAYVPAIAAESGFIAAHLAAEGFSCGIRAFDGHNGLLELLTVTPAVDRALAGLGSVSEAAQTAFKPYPCGIVIHPVIDATLALYHEHGVRPAEIRSIKIFISRTANDLVANRNPADEIQAQVSLFFWAAAVLSTGTAGLEHLTMERVSDPLIQSLQDRINASVREDLADDQCVAKATLADGRSVQVVVEHAVGSMDRPMSAADIDRKVLALAGPVISEDGAARLLATARNVLSLDNVATILNS